MGGPLDHDATSGASVGGAEQVAVRNTPAPWLFVLFTGGLGGISVGLAVAEEFAAGRARFAGDAWRIALGAAGAFLVFIAARGAVRHLKGWVARLTPERHRRTRRRGWVLFALGAWLFGMATFADLARETIAFRSWADPVYTWGGLYLVALGLAAQLDPTGVIRRARVMRGEGEWAVARILGTNDTGTSTGAHPIVAVELEIDLKDRKVVASDNVVADEARRALLVPGATVNVQTDRTDPTIFRVDWESWRGPRAEE